MIRNVVFDMGNVMVRFDMDMFMDQKGVKDEKDRKLVKNELFRSPEWALMDRGVLTEETAEPTITSRFPDRLKGQVRELLYNWWTDREMIPGMAELTERIHAAGYGIYLLSNASVSQKKYWPEFPVSQLFRGTLISADEGMIKPDLEIYKRFTDRFGLNPEECVFIDDLSSNVAAAIVCGWKGIVFNGSADELERKLREMGLKF